MKRQELWQEEEEERGSEEKKSGKKDRSLGRIVDDTPSRVVSSPAWGETVENVTRIRRSTSLW